jgi:hypothetical protein
MSKLRGAKIKEAGDERTHQTDPKAAVFPGPCAGTTGVPAEEANRIINLVIGDPKPPLPLSHDHFIGRAGGVAIFQVNTPQNGMEC